MKIRQLLDDYVELLLTDWKGALCKYYSENIVRKIKFQEAEDYFEILEGVEACIEHDANFLAGLSAPITHDDYVNRVDEERNLSFIEVTQSFTHEAYGQATQRISCPGPLAGFFYCISCNAVTCPELLSSYWLYGDQ